MSLEHTFLAFGVSSASAKKNIDWRALALRLERATFSWFDVIYRQILGKFPCRMVPKVTASKNRYLVNNDHVGE
jgi:hypothetical protein